MRSIISIMAVIGLYFFSVFAFAQDGSSDLKFLTDVYQYIGQFGGLAWMAKIAGVSLLIIASMKVSFLKPVWDWFGKSQAFIAPALGLLAGLMSLGSQLTWASALAYVGSGAGAIILHELLDAVKSIPGLGAIYVTVINFIEGLPFFGAGKPQ